MCGSFTDHAQSRSMNDISDTPSTDQVTVQYFMCACMCVVLWLHIAHAIAVGPSTIHGNHANPLTLSD